MKAWSFFKEHTTECIVICSFTLVLIFSAVSVYVSVNGMSLSDTLIEYFFKFFGFEMLALSGIKISKHIGSAFGKAEDAIDGMMEFCEEDVEEESDAEDSLQEKESED